MAENFFKKLIKNTGKGTGDRVEDVIYLPPANELHLPVATGEETVVSGPPPIVLAPSLPKDKPVELDTERAPLVIPAVTSEEGLPWWAKDAVASRPAEQSREAAPLQADLPPTVAPASPSAVEQEPAEPVVAMDKEEPVPAEPPVTAHKPAPSLLFGFQSADLPPMPPMKVAEAPEPVSPVPAWADPVHPAASLREEAAPEEIASRRIDPQPSAPVIEAEIPEPVAVAPVAPVIEPPVEAPAATTVDAPVWTAPVAEEAPQPVATQMEPLPTPGELPVQAPSIAHFEAPEVPAPQPVEPMADVVAPAESVEPAAVTAPGIQFIQHIPAGPEAEAAAALAEEAAPEPVSAAAIPEPVLMEVPMVEASIPEPEREGEPAARREASEKRLGVLLMEHKLITRAQLERALATQTESGEPVGTILVRNKAITERRLLQVLAAHHGVSAWHLENDPPAPEALTLMQGEVCKALCVLPVAVRGDLLLLAMSDPGDIDAIETVRDHTKLRIEPVMADEGRLRHAIDSFYSIRDSRELAKLDNLVERALKETGTRKKGERAQLSEEDTRPVVGLVNQIIQDAIRMRASDIHVEPRYDCAEIRYRLDGELLKVREVPEALIPMLTTRIKIMAEMDIVEYRTPQDGRITAQIGPSTVDIRVSCLPTMHGRRLVLRILDKAVGLKRLDHLGFDPENLAMFKTLVAKPYGLFLVTGPTGSGKTTTLYAALNEVKREGINIMTCEDPVEYDVAGVNQSQVNEKVGLTFAEQLRAILRQDPDIVLVGEIRDAETAQTAIRAALTGHLVLSTLHTNDAPSAVPRLLDIGVDPYLLSTALIGSMSQRLIRVLCPDCKEHHEADSDDRELLSNRYGLNGLDGLYRAKGCKKCFNTGYRGRVAVHEIMPVVDEVGNLISSRAPVEHIRETARHYGYMTMQEDALARVLRGETSLDEAKRLLFFDSFQRSDEPRHLRG